MYDDGKLQDFMNAAERLLKDDPNFNPDHTANLLILAMNTVAGPNAALEAYYRARESCNRARRPRHTREEFSILHELELKLNNVRVACLAEWNVFTTEQIKEVDRTFARGTARKTARDRSIKAGLDSAVNFQGRDHGSGSSPEAGTPSRKRRRVEESVGQETSEKRGKASTGQEDTLKIKLRAFLEGEREVHAMLVKRHQTEIENHRREIGEHKSDIKKQEAGITTQRARIQEIDKELARLFE